MAHTKVNLLEVEDLAAGHGLSHTQQARFPRERLGTEQTGLVHLVVKPGRREAFAHRHARAEEVLVVLGGSGWIELEGESLELARLDAVRIPPGVVRRLEAGAEGLEVLVFGPHVTGDAEVIREP